MSIDQLTIGEARGIAEMFNGNKPDTMNPYTIGQPWFFRTVTHHLSGVVKEVGRQEIVLQGGTVQWIAVDGRFGELFENGEPEQSEPYGKRDVVIGRGAIIDATSLGALIEVKTR